MAVQSVTLIWNPSTDPNVTGYNVYYGVASRTYTNKLDVGSATNATVNGLVEGATYYFAATAYNLLGVESDYSSEVSYTVPLPAATNQAPTLNAIGNLTLLEDAVQQTVNLSGITSGSASESQTLTVTASSSNPGLIPSPAVSYSSPNATGSLAFTPTANASGTAVITVTVNDGQATNNTLSRTFTVTVNPVNDLPTLTALGNLTLNEGAVQQTVSLAGISSGASDESQTLVVTATSANTALIPNPTVTYTSPNATGSLAFTPVAGANGSATITVTVNDGGSSNNVFSRTFTVAVNAVNDPPTLNALGDLTVNEDAGQQSVSLSGISTGATNETQTLVVTATSSNTALIPNPTVAYTSPNATGTLTFTPVANASGSATITVTVNDGQASGNLVTRTFTVTVNPVNDVPTLNPVGNLTLNENAPQQTVNINGISTGATNEAQTITVSATSDNTGLIPNPTVTYTSPGTNGTLRFTPVAGAKGSALITVTVNDGGASNNVASRTFTVTVNGAPSISVIPNQLISVNSNTGPVGFVIGDAETAAGSLTLSAASSAAALIPVGNIAFGGSGSNRTVTLTPVAGQSGTANVTVTVSDGSSSASTTFQLGVLGIPTPPQILTIVTNGAGTVSASASPSKMVLGKVYTLTAVPAEGQEFAGWSGSLTSSSPKLTLYMSNKAVVQANFVPSPFKTGSYNGLFYEDEQVRLGSSGAFTVVVTKHGSYSGRLQLGTGRFSFRGKFDLDCRATNVIARKTGGALTLQLQLGTNDMADRISGQLISSNWVAGLHGDRAVFGKTNAAPFAGNYTLVIPGTDGNPSVPAGDGYGSVKVNAVGRALLSGVLADGTKITQSAPLSKDGAWPLYASLYRGAGLIESWITFANRSEDDLRGDLSWIKTTNAPAKFDPVGFDVQSGVVGSVFASAPGTNVLNAPAAEVAFAGGNLGAGFSNQIQIAFNNQVVNASSNSLSLSFYPNTGTFRGKVTDPASGRQYAFGGAVLQKLDAGFGTLMGTNLSSRVYLQP